MNPEMNALEALKARKAVERDRECLERRFDGVGFVELGAEHRQRAFARLEAFLMASDPVATCPLAEARSLIPSADIDARHRMAIRLGDSASGAWFVMDDAGPVLRALGNDAPEGLALYDCEADVLYAVHEAEYQWEYYEVR